MGLPQSGECLPLHKHASSSVPAYFSSFLTFHPRPNDGLSSDNPNSFLNRLVATLGQNSTSKKINRKAILGVDVPRACDTIMHPEAPMALRLQGNLLYGISKVYSRQCVYTLTDVQAMLDKMKTALKVVHGRGLHVDAGKARPEELVVPYDPAFIPDFTFPGLDLDLLNPCGPAAPDLKLNSNLISSNLSVSPHSQLDLDTLPQLDVDSSSNTLAEFGRFSFDSGSIHSAKQRNVFGRSEIKTEEEGVLLQPDFDFDEEGNIFDLVMTDAPAIQVETPVRGRSEDIVQVPQENATMVTPVGNNLRDGLQQDDNLDAREGSSPTWGRLPDPEYVDKSPQDRNAGSNRKIRARKALEMDALTQIARGELLLWDKEYLQNMSRLDIQKAYARSLAQARKNATSWISGRGIGSVGIGLGVDCVSHPLKSFCGEALIIALSDEQPMTKQGRKRSSSDVSHEEGRNVRPKVSHGELEVSVAHPGGPGGQQEDVELGLDAPPSLPDDAPSQMPWNITASLQGSVAGSSSVSRYYYGGLGRRGSRFPSASPLAGRGLPQDLFGHDSLSSLSLRDFGGFHDDGSGGFMDEDQSAQHAELSKFESQLTVSSLDDTDRNFVDFLKVRVQHARLAQDGEESSQSQKMAFSKLLPPKLTSRAVATQALMHVLTLASKSIIQVSQSKRCQGPAYVIDDLDEIRLVIRG
ncbi:hypothetical protein UA08_02925 [Talaromyces atroroseus]|uniref:Rad21/Rec8-like protein N-terminal domain-containing protein n=1 Tax=Talaromyces atroroseus TaxID=1441469 RepID=A0A225B3D7_TALAT|nr:hypothetical protein UA08_02925 [Talaromyces atroroseus]OKL62519.1 hypothetical protein UA08_02925 [Talaromyces atroroseus]